MKVWEVRLPSPPKSSCVYYNLLGDIDVFELIPMSLDSESGKEE